MISDTKYAHAISRYENLARAMYRALKSVKKNSTVSDQVIDILMLSVCDKLAIIERFRVPGLSGAEKHTIVDTTIEPGHRELLSSAKNILAEWKHYIHNDEFAGLITAMNSHQPEKADSIEFVIKLLTNPVTLAQIAKTAECSENTASFMLRDLIY